VSLLSRGRRAGVRLTVSAWIVVIAMTGFATLTVNVSTVSAVVCDTSWTAGSGDWANSANWSSGVPDSTKNACLPAGAYTVTARASTAALKLDIASGPTLVISNDTNNNQGALSAGSDVTNAGTIELTTINNCGGCSTTLSIASGSTLTNTGSLISDPGDGGPRAISGSIDNQGTFNVNASTTLDPGTLNDSGSIDVADGKTLTNVDDTVRIKPGGTFSLNSSGSYTQQSGATLWVTIDATTNSYTGISGGQTNLGGTLKVTTIGTPAENSAWQIIPGTTTGAFDSTAFDIPYTVQYGSVTLIAPAPSTYVTHQPDGFIKLWTGPFVGGEIYNTTADGQSKSGSVALGRRIIFRIGIENESNRATDAFTVQATGTVTTGYRVRYLSGTTDITNAVVNGTYQTTDLAPEQYVVIKVIVRVTRDAAEGSQVTRLVTLTSVADSSQQDAVSFTCMRK
jgi:hypothetical protein